MTGNDGHETKTFTKHDTGKLRFDLVDPDWFRAVAEVLTQGAVKYADDNWKQGTVDRYIAALHRHANAVQCGEPADPESGLSHWVHVAVNAMFLYWMQRNPRD